MLISNKVLLITNIPTPYRIPLFNELNVQLESRGYEFKVIFGALGYARRKWDVDLSECAFDYQVLPSKKLPSFNPEKTIFTYSGLSRLLLKENPVAVITTAYCLATAKLWLRSWVKNVPYIIWSGAVDHEYDRDFFLRRVYRKLLVKRASGFIAYGTKAKEYLVSLGADKDKVQIGINTVDTQFFREETRKMRENRVSRNDNKHLLYIGHLSPRKNVWKLLKVINELSRLRSDFVLDVVGDGEERELLEKYVFDTRLEDRVKFHGFKQKENLPQYLAQSDCFLFQTDFDIWGLVLVEAMAAALPCIASIHAGAAYDLIKNGENGFTTDFSKIEEAADKINWVLMHPELARDIGENASRYVAKEASIRNSASGFVQAIWSALNCRLPH